VELLTVTNTLAYYDTELMESVEIDPMNFPSSSMTHWQKS